MSRKVLSVLFLLLLLLLPAVASAAEVRVDVDRKKDFSRYQTFAVEVGPLVRADGAVDSQNTLAENRLRDAIEQEFQARGLEPGEAMPDLIVRVSGRDAERNEVIATPRYIYPSFWYRRRAFWGYPYARFGYPYSYNDVYSRRFVEGSITIDVIERATGALVYRAQVLEEVHGNRDKQVAKMIDKALKKFPVKEAANN